jgi:hypothetical protein
MGLVSKDFARSGDYFGNVCRGCQEIRKMKNKKEFGLLLLLALVLISILIVNGGLSSKAENKALSKAVFYVS